MKNFLIRIVVNALALAAAAWLFDGIQMSDDVLDVLLVALVFGISTRSSSRSCCSSPFRSSS